MAGPELEDEGFLVAPDPVEEMLEILKLPEHEQGASLSEHAQRAVEKAERFADRWVEERVTALAK